VCALVHVFPTDAWRFHGQSPVPVEFNAATTLYTSCNAHTPPSEARAGVAAEEVINAEGRRGNVKRTLLVSP
jgi:hypothetical protein